MKTLVIIPAFNEADSIASVVRTVMDAGYDYVVVNDGSRDETRSICAQNGFHCINLPENLGIGGAMQTGHRYALANDYDADVQFDGDGQHDIDYIPNLIKELDTGVDLVIGSRFLSENDGFKSSVARRMGIKWLKAWIKICAGCEITDSTSGFRACSRNAIELFCGYYPFDYPEPESAAYAHMNGLIVKEVPVKMNERQGGSSSIAGLSSAYYMLKVTMSIAIQRLRKKRGRS